MIRFPSISQFRNIIKVVKQQATYSGKDSDGNATFNRQAIAPKLNFFGTVKLHGTNASIVQEVAGGKLTYQSRERTVTADSDNAGFAGAMLKLDMAFLLESARFDLRTKANTPVTIYGEWCGGNIQSSVGINGLNKMFVIFAIREGVSEVVNDDGNIIIPNTTLWYRPGSFLFSTVMDNALPESVFSIDDFRTFEVEVDFESPETAQNEFVKLTLEVEAECPVAKSFGISGVGEGIVWHCTDSEYQSSDFVFKTKGEKHSASKVKVVAAVNVEKITAIKELVETIMTDNRLNQMLDGIELDSKNTGIFIKKCMSDAIKEETDTIIENGFTIKDFSKFAMLKVRTWFFQKLS